MMDDDNMDPARGRLKAIESSGDAPLGFSIRRKIRLGATRLGILSVDEEDIEGPAPSPGHTASHTLVTGTEDIRGEGEPGPDRSTIERPAEAIPPAAMPEPIPAESQQPRTPSPEVPTQRPTPKRPARRPKHSPYADARRDDAVWREVTIELPERKKGTFLLPLRTILEIRAFANLTKRTQYEIVDQAVSEFIADTVDRMSEQQQQRMSELVKRHAYKARVAAEKRARGRAARGGKKLDLATRWEPPEDGRMAHFARRVRSGQNPADSTTESPESASQEDSPRE